MVALLLYLSNMHMHWKRCIYAYFILKLAYFIYTQKWVYSKPQDASPHEFWCFNILACNLCTWLYTSKCYQLHDIMVSSRYTLSKMRILAKNANKNTMRSTLCTYKWMRCYKSDVRALDRLLYRYYAYMIVLLSYKCATTTSLLKKKTIFESSWMYRHFGLFSAMLWQYFGKAEVFQSSAANALSGLSIQLTKQTTFPLTLINFHLQSI